MFKERVKRGGLIGTFIMVPSPDLLQIAGLAGFDFVVIDLEHGALSFSDVPPLINAALASGVRPIVRVGKLEPLMIGKALDAGADAVLVPSIETPQEAASAVAAAKFAPLGVRGACLRVRGARYGARTAAEFYGSENDEKAVILLVESAKGIQNLEGILETDGLDAIFLGYADLSHSLGYASQPGHPVVVEWIEGALLRAIASKVAVGISCLTEVEAGRRLQAGVRFVTFSGLETLALNGCRQAMARVRDQAGALTATTARDSLCK